LRGRSQAPCRRGARVRRCCCGNSVTRAGRCCSMYFAWFRPPPERVGASVCAGIRFCIQHTVVSHLQFIAAGAASTPAACPLGLLCSSLCSGWGSVAGIWFAAPGLWLGSGLPHLRPGKPDPGHRAPPRAEGAAICWCCVYALPHGRSVAWIPCFMGASHQVCCCASSSAVLCASGGAQGCWGANGGRYCALGNLQCIRNRAFEQILRPAACHHARILCLFFSLVGCERIPRLREAMGGSRLISITDRAVLDESRHCCAARTVLLSHPRPKP
jgi:hypothetical protein